MFDPQLTILSTPREGNDVYVGAMQRMVDRAQRPPSPLLHCAGTRADEFLAFTAFTTREEMMAMYTSFTVPEAVNEMVDTGVRVDIARDEYELASMFIADIVPQFEFGIKSPGSIAAYYCDRGLENYDEYLELATRHGMLRGEPHGLLAHLAFATQDGIEVFDAWESRALGERWYSENLPQVDDPGDWLELTSFIVCTPPGDSRRFLRNGVGALPE